MSLIEFGPQITGDLDAASTREWLVTDGLGGYAMGTVSGLATRRYHGLLMVATAPPIGRMLGLAALDPVLTIGDATIRLGTTSGATERSLPTATCTSSPSRSATACRDGGGPSAMWSSTPNWR